MSSNLANMRATVRLSIKNPDTDSDSLFGRGIANLCIGVRDAGSLNAAAKNMGMAYSKAWRIIKETEAALGVQLLDRDGAHGSTLTEEGAKLVDAYIEVNRVVNETAQKCFDEIVAR